MIPFSLYKKEYFWSYDQKYYKFSYYFLYISAAYTCISQIDQNGVNPFCNETLHMVWADFAKILQRYAVRFTMPEMIMGPIA